MLLPLGEVARGEEELGAVNFLFICWSTVLLWYPIPYFASKLKAYMIHFSMYTYYMYQTFQNEKKLKKIDLDIH